MKIWNSIVGMMKSYPIAELRLGVLLWMASIMLTTSWLALVVGLFLESMPPTVFFASSTLVVLSVILIFWIIVFEPGLMVKR